MTVAVAAGAEVSIADIRAGHLRERYDTIVIPDMGERAILDGRYAVAIDDIRKLAGPVLVHRVVRNFHAEADGMRASELIATIVDQVAS